MMHFGAVLESLRLHFCRMRKRAVRRGHSDSGAAVVPWWSSFRPSKRSFQAARTTDTQSGKAAKVQLFSCSELQMDMLALQTFHAISHPEVSIDS